MKSTDDYDWDAESCEDDSPIDPAGTEEYREAITFDNGATYVGEWLGEDRHGYGLQQWKDGAKYEGQWKNDNAHGKGTLIHSSGDKYEGEWKRDKAHGYGKYTHIDGQTYEG